ncbi:MAG TPA: hypothetical protein DCE56_27355 [Cyanobacteria bacterium UBA8553]|nr:hypothetical protein [Cyanobacteria bacterium UBA8553]HAJ60676.1 hypothetical protein [Cyanobacteria bacterium UBA8543]
MKFLLLIYEWLQKNLRPPSAFSWETLILLSLFSFYMEWLARSLYLKNLLDNLGWIFLIGGVYWATTATRFLRIGYKAKPWTPGFPLSPWITGALVCYYLFNRGIGEVRPESIIYWPTISALIYAIPDFLQENGTLKSPPPDRRQFLVVVLGTQLLLSCWFQFHFLVQNLVAQYPTVLVEDFNKSAFVVKWETPQTTTPRGVDILENMEPQLRDRLSSKPWPQVERMLLRGKERDNWIKSIAKKTKDQLSPPAEEDALWQIKYDVKKFKSSGYNLALIALWNGPRSNPQQSIKNYSLTKYCQITPIYPQGSLATKPINSPQTSPTPVSRVECQPVKGWGVDPPNNRRDSFIRT